MQDKTASLMWLLGVRLLLRSKQRFAKLVTWVSLVGLTLGVIVLTVVTTVMNGFDSELQGRILDSLPHVKVRSSEIGHEQLQDSIDRVVSGQTGVSAVHRYFEGVGAVTHAGRVQPLSLYGVDESGETSLRRFAQGMEIGTLKAFFSNPRAVLLGRPVARSLGLVAGDSVTLLVVTGDRDRVTPRSARFTLAGTYELGSELDYRLALVNPALFWDGEIPAGQSGIQIQYADPLEVISAAGTLRSALPSATVEPWTESYGELFQAVQLEKTMMFVMLLLIVAIASFNIVAGQTMLVTEKRADIAILRTMGASSGVIRRTFLLQGALIGIVGTLTGISLGLVCVYYINPILAVVRDLTGMHLLDGSFFVEVPTLVQVRDLILISLCCGGIAVLASWLPAHRAAELNPIEGLH